MGQILVTPCPIEGLYVIEPKVHGDARGWLMEVFNQRDLKEAGIDRVFVQENESCSDCCRDGDRDDTAEISAVHRLQEEDSSIYRLSGKGASAGDNWHAGGFLPEGCQCDGFTFRHSGADCRFLRRG
ncbi:MAG: dTDP-4-dehydrorhamnose 3,5-epimerase family protein, partial [Lachnospiraceae bacterium]|nr:dTDP-4-dehydrorhamnose 3,5-epimerase family protein [Lachnospiraceae bacterium]